jgi:NDP-sugar pyrophosphorylase family protein
MKAMILAAGLGTRLKPLTDTRPKALVELAGRTLLEITLTRLRTFGITEFIVNVHHFADQVVDYLKSHKKFGLRIEISREEILLDTGGGLKKAAWFFLEDPKSLDEPFLLHNVDVISNIDLRAMLQFHAENHALATLAVQSRESSRQLLFNNALQLCGRRISGTTSPSVETAPNCHSERSEESAFSSNSPLVYPEPRGATRHSFTPSETEGPLPLAFSGIHILSPRLLPLLTEDRIFSIIDSYLRLSAQSQKILAFRADQYYWRDLGRPADLAQAALDLQQKSLNI